MESRMLRKRQRKMGLSKVADMDYRLDFSDGIKTRSMSTSTPMGSRLRSKSFSIFQSDNDSGYPDSMTDSTDLDNSAFLDSTITSHLSESSGCEIDACCKQNHEVDCSPVLEIIEWPEHSDLVDVSSERCLRRLSDLPKYSLNFETPNHDSSFSTVSLSAKFDSVGLSNVLRHFSPCEPDRLIGRKIGVEKVDILSEMDSRNLSCVSLVLSFLEPADLCRLRMVCPRWKSICDADGKSTTRRRQFLKTIKGRKSLYGKENGGKMIITRQRLHCLTNGQVLTTVQPTASTPKSPKKTSISNQFTKAVSTLRSDECLRHCPNCHSPAKMYAVQDRGVCLNERCKFDFCLKCFWEHHGAKSCVPVVTKKSKVNSAGSKKSKRFLRRL